MKEQYEQRSKYFQAAMEAEANPDFGRVEALVNSELDPEHAQELSQLKVAQNSDVLGVYLELFPGADVTGAEWRVTDDEDVNAYARNRQEVLGRQREHIAQDHERDLAILQEEQAAKKQEIEKRQQEQQTEFDRLVTEADTRAKARNKKMMEMRDEQKKKELEQMQGLGEQQKEDIMAEHRKNMKQYELALENETARQKAIFVKRLATKRKQQEERREEREKRKFDEDKQRLTDLKDKKGGKKKHKSRESDGDSEADERRLKEMERLEKERYEKEEGELKEKKVVLDTMARIESMVAKIEHAGEGVGRPALYVDDRDTMEFTESGKSSPEHCDPSVITSRAFVVYRFGVALIKIFSDMQSSKAGKEGSVKPVRLLLATSLPRNPHQSVAYRNSFHYTAHDHTLFIRRERLEEVGEFVLVLLHSLAHVAAAEKAGDAGWDDASPAFAKELHAMLRVVCADLFFSRTQKPLAAAGNEDAPASVAKRAAVDMLLELYPRVAGDGSGTTRASALSGAMEHEFYSTNKLLTRMGDYEAFSQSIKLREHIVNLERTAGGRDHNALAQQAELQYRAGNTPGRRKADLQKEAGGISAKSAEQEEVLQGLEDDLNADLAEVMQQLFQTSQRLQSAGNKADVVSLERSKMTQLAHRKEVLTHRLRNIQAATFGGDETA
jgi:hypothetical protein